MANSKDEADVPALVVLTDQVRHLKADNRKLSIRLSDLSAKLAVLENQVSEIFSSQPAPDKYPNLAQPVKECVARDFPAIAQWEDFTIKFIGDGSLEVSSPNAITTKMHYNTLRNRIEIGLRLPRI